MPLFLRLFLWFSWRHMKYYLWRTVAVVLGIALGAAVFTSVRFSVHASVDAFARGVEFITGQTDRIVIRPGGRIPETVLTGILKHPLVRSASPILTTYVKDTGPDSTPFLLIGFDPLLDRPVRNWEVATPENDIPDLWLKFIAHPDTLIVGEPLAQLHDLNAGDSWTLEHGGRQHTFKVLGNLASDGVSLIEGGQVALADIATFQEFTGIFGLVDRIDIVLADDASQAVLADIQALLPDGVELKAPAETTEGGYKMIQAYQLNLSVLSFVSLFVGMFLVYSLVAVNAASRRRELSILRAVGASSRMLFFLFVTEGLFLGIAGWLMGIPIASVLVKYLLKGVSQTISTLFVRIQVDQLTLSPWEIMLSFSVTVGVCALAALGPAREAMRVKPQESMVMIQSTRIPRMSSHKLGICGLVSILCVWPLSLIPECYGLPIAGYTSVFLLFVGFVMLTPWVLSQVSRMLSPILCRMMGEPAYIASRYLKDSSLQTAVSVGALITAVALFSSIVIMVYSFRQTVTLWVNQTLSGDVFVWPKMAELNHYRYPLSQEVVSELKQLNSEIDLVPYHRYYLDYGQAPYQLEVIDLKTLLTYGSFYWVKGYSRQAQADLIQGKGVVVSEVFSRRTGLTPGDRFEARIGSEHLALPVLGIVRDYRTNGGVVYYSMPRFETSGASNNGFGIQQMAETWGGVRLFFRNRDADIDKKAILLQQRIRKRWGDELEMLSGKDLRRKILKIFDATFAITTVLMVIALAVAGLGIAALLAVLVLQRSRQLNTLIAVGASTGQISSMICWESLLMVVVGECAGLICGCILSYLLIYVINYQTFGWTFLYYVDWIKLAVSFPLIIIIALIAAVPAIWLVFRDSPAISFRER